MLLPKEGTKSIALARIAVVTTVAACLAFVVTTIWRVSGTYGGPGLGLILDAITYIAIITLLSCSSLAYLIARIGCFVRAGAHRRTARAELDGFYAEHAPKLTVLVPSYREEPRIIRKTLLSAALQEFRDLRVVLLIDDPPNPADPYNRRLLRSARELPSEIAELLAPPRAEAEAALRAFEVRFRRRKTCLPADLRELADAYDRAVEWLSELCAEEPVVDHVDRFFETGVVRRLSDDLALVADALRAAAAERADLPPERLGQLYHRLVWIFSADLSSFERKRYACLSSEQNKAMNLNSYLGLMGGSYAVRETGAGRVLTPAAEGEADLVVPDSDYVLTLDADSVLLPEYCTRMVHLLEQPENCRVAVAQTPYSAYPGSPSRVERIAGATTDLQHIVHQGMTHFGATYWVGANAVIRKAALDDISSEDWWGDFRIRRYIHDRTVIEDTESTIDLGIKGWRLFNYPERLSYSATPPDFGSLCIQRRRWACGGLLILPRLWRHLRNARKRGERVRPLELFLRVNYLASIAWSNVSLLVLLALPYINILPGPLVVLAAVPYFAAMASDLHRCGYRRSDVLRIYGFNLILLPVNLAGVITSLGQGITGAKIPFARTPKIRDRTTAGLPFVLGPYVLIAISALTAVHYALHHSWLRAAFAAMNAILAAYATVAFVGLRNSAVDVWMNAVKHLYRPARARRPAVASVRTAPERLDWEAVLQQGQAPAPAASAPEHRGDVVRLPSELGVRAALGDAGLEAAS